MSIVKFVAAERRPSSLEFVALDDRLVAAARRLVTVNPAVALWALERAATQEFGSAGAAAMRSMAGGFDALALVVRDAESETLELAPVA